MVNNQNGYDPNWYPRNNNWQGSGSQQFQTTNWGYAAPTAQQTYQERISGIPGKVIRDIKDIRPNDVPMDGSIGYYPLSDGKVIIVKKWTGNGTIETARYILDEPDPENGKNSETNQNDTQYQQILDKLGAIEKAIYRKQPYHKNNFNQNKMKQEDKTHGE